MRIMPARIAALEVDAHRGRGDGRVVSVVCGSSPESVAFVFNKGEEQTRKMLRFLGQHQTLLCLCSK
jgi:hypothetical protein